MLEALHGIDWLLDFIASYIYLHLPSSHFDFIERFRSCPLFYKELCCRYHCWLWNAFTGADPSEYFIWMVEQSRVAHNMGDSTILKGSDSEPEILEDFTRRLGYGLTHYGFFPTSVISAVAVHFNTENHTKQHKWTKSILLWSFISWANENMFFKWYCTQCGRWIDHWKVSVFMHFNCPFKVLIQGHSQPSALMYSIFAWED